MKKILALIVLAVLVCGCSHTESESYIGFTREDFQGKTIYLMDSENPGQSKKLVFQDDTVKASMIVSSGFAYVLKWELISGQLMTSEIVAIADPPLSYRYTLFNDDIKERCFTVARKRPNDELTIKIMTMFYDQETGFNQAKDWLESH